MSAKNKKLLAVLGAAAVAVHSQVLLLQRFPTELYRYAKYLSINSLILFTCPTCIAVLHFERADRLQNH